MNCKLALVLFAISSVVAGAAESALTIYNQNFGVVRETIPLDLTQGLNRIRFTGTTAHVEPESVILRDPTGRRLLQILEQNYRADPISEPLLLSLYEGQTIDFLVTSRERQEIVRGKIIRSGYVPHQTMLRRYGPQYQYAQISYAQGGAGQPILEVDGKLRFSLPGQPLFPALADDTILKPTIDWLLDSGSAGKLDAELCYVSGGMSWSADYNIVAPENGDVLDLVGWVTMDNQSGKTFENARIKLMAGDVSKLQPGSQFDRRDVYAEAVGVAGLPPPVIEKTFDEYHLYSLQRPATLHDRETKQVEFVRAGGVGSQRVYVYDGAKIDHNRYRGYNIYNIREDVSYGTDSNPKIWVMREFSNSQANRLGMPLPQGRVRFYRRDNDGRIEFTGENTIQHTPRDETVRVYTGNAFDLVGQRRRTDYRVDSSQRWVHESFEIKLRNHKKEPAEVRVVEHLYRWHNWEIAQRSDAFTKTDSQTIEFRIPLKAGEERTVTYTAHYTW